VYEGSMTSRIPNRDNRNVLNLKVGNLKESIINDDPYNKINN
jgi:hypothetical protein